MVSSVVSNPNERLVTSRIDDESDLHLDVSVPARKSRSKLIRRTIVAVVVLSFIAGLSVLSYYLVNKYKSLNEFKSQLNQHLSKDFPNLGKSERDACFKELSKLFSDGLISKDAKLEYEVYREFEQFNTKYNKSHSSQKQRHDKLVIFRKNYLEVKNQKG